MLFLVSSVTLRGVFGQKDICYHVPQPPASFSIYNERPLLAMIDAGICKGLPKFNGLNGNSYIFYQRLLIWCCTSWLCTMSAIFVNVWNNVYFYYLVWDWISSSLLCKDKKGQKEADGRSDRFRARMWLRAKVKSGEVGTFSPYDLTSTTYFMIIFILYWAN